mgnify:CR=1 FL=1
MRATGAIALQRTPSRMSSFEATSVSAAIAALAGLTVDYPAAMIRKPKAWLNHITKMNPGLRAEVID